jgi:protein SCO1
MTWHRDSAKPISMAALNLPHCSLTILLVLMTIVINPDQDQGKALERYADTWKADPATCHFLTGTLSDVRNIAGLFGMNFWADDGFLTHSFHTVVIDREGKLAANLEGNQFTAEQLGDLVETTLRRPVGGK